MLESEVYLGSLFGEDPPEKIELKTIKDCIPYYPHIVSFHAFDKIYLSRESWVDISERRYGKMKMHEYYRQRLKKEIERYQLGGENSNE